MRQVKMQETAVEGGQVIHDGETAVSTGTAAAENCIPHPSPPSPRTQRNRKQRDQISEMKTIAEFTVEPGHPGLPEVVESEPEVEIEVENLKTGVGDPTPEDGSMRSLLQVRSQDGASCRSFERALDSYDVSYETVSRDDVSGEALYRAEPRIEDSTVLVALEKTGGELVDGDVEPNCWKVYSRHPTLSRSRSSSASVKNPTPTSRSRGCTAPSTSNTAEERT